MGGNFSERSQKKGTKKIVPKEKVFMRGVQTDRKKKLHNQTRRKVAEMKEREEMNLTRTTNTKSEQNFKRKNMTKVHNFQENYHFTNRTCTYKHIIDSQKLDFSQTDSKESLPRAWRKRKQNH